MTTDEGSLFRTLFLRPILSEKRHVGMILAALVALSLSQSTFLVLAGPLLKAFFELGSSANWLELSRLLPAQLLGHPWLNLADYKISVATLSWSLPILLLGAGLFKSLASYFYQYHQQALSLFIAKNYRDRLFASILKQNYIQFGNQSAGRWMSIVMNDVMILQARFTDLVGSLIKDTVLVVSCIFVLTWIHWPTACTLLVLTPFLAWFLGRSGRRISGFAEAWQKKLADMNAHLLSIRQRFQFIRAQEAEARELALFQARNRSYYQLIRQSLFLRAGLAPSLEFLGFCIFAMLIFLIHSGYWFQADFAKITMIEFFAALGLIMRPLKNIGEQVTRFQETKGILEQSLKTFRQIERAQAYKSLNATDREQALPQDLIIADFQVAYQESFQFQIKDLHLKRGRRIAVIGPSGSGKSTILKCLGGLLAPQCWSGSIDWASLVSHSSFVSQKPFLFDDTLRSNLLYGLNAITDEAIWTALKRVSMQEVIASLPDGLATKVRSIQSNFSGGQIQRLMIARALLRGRDLLLMDEVTSAIDAPTEEEITKELIKLVKDQNLFLIFVTHRLRWLHLFDEIWFIEGGKITFQGPFSKLVLEPRYQEFVVEPQATEDLNF